MKNHNPGARSRDPRGRTEARNYPCDIYGCKKVYETSTSVTRHKRLDHFPAIITVAWWVLIDEAKRTQTSVGYTCPCRNITALSMDAISEHLLRNRDESHVREHERLAEMINPELDVEHETEAQRGAPFSCPIPGCPETFQVPSALKSHYNTTHHGTIPPVALDTILAATKELRIGECPCGLYKGKNRQDLRRHLQSSKDHKHIERHKQVAQQLDPDIDLEALNEPNPQLPLYPDRMQTTEEDEDDSDLADGDDADADDEFILPPETDFDREVNDVFERRDELGFEVTDLNPFHYMMSLHCMPPEQRENASVIDVINFGKELIRKDSDSQRIREDPVIRQAGDY